jgi:hypothetical protein
VKTVAKNILQIGDGINVINAVFVFANPVCQYIKENMVQADLSVANVLLVK